MTEKIETNNEISSKDFQRKLFDWFDKRGLLSELRAFMRHRMISALYSAESPCPPSHFPDHTAISPTLQALLLLVAEFLVQQDYHYTMSVMVAEAPLLASFPKFSGYVSYMSQTDSSVLRKGRGFPRYSDKDVQEILEVLGMKSDSESMEHVLRLYSNNKARESLLACVLTALSAIAQNNMTQTPKQSNLNENWQRMSDETHNSTQWIEEIRLVLLRAQLTSHQLQQVEDLLRKLQSDTAQKARKEESEKNGKLNHIREQELLADMLVREEKFRAQMQEAEEDLRSKQKHLEQVTIQLKQQHDEVLNRLNRVQKHADEMKRQETELDEREKALERKQKIIEEEHRTLVGLRTELQEAAHSLRQDHSDTKTILELNRLQEKCLHLESELRDTKNQILASSINRAEMGVQVSDLSSNLKPMNMAESQENCHSSSSSVSSSIENFQGLDKKEKNKQVILLKRVLCRVQQENLEFRAIAAQQRRRIDELTSRAAQLADHLAQQTMAPSSLSTQHPSLKSQIEERTPQPPPLPPRHVRGGLQAGAGDNPPQMSSLNVPGTVNQISDLQGRFGRRKPTRRQFQHVIQTSSLSSDESPTEEVLREARNRLKKLEEESEAVDQSYRDFRARQSDIVVPSSSMQVSPKDPNGANLSSHPTFENTQSLSPMQAAASPYLHSTSISLPTVSHLVSSPLSRSFQFRPRTVSRLSLGIPLRPRTHSVYQGKTTSSVLGTNLSRSLTSLPNHVSALQSPVDRLRNLLGAYTSYKTKVPVESNQNKDDLLSSKKSQNYSLNDKNGQEAFKEVAEIEKISLKSTSENNATSIKKTDDQVRDSIVQMLPKNCDVKGNENKSHQPFLQKSVHEERSGDKPKMTTAPDIDANMNVLPLPNVNEHSSPKSLGVEEPLSPNVPHLQSPGTPASPERIMMKSNPHDGTLNEISTLSSSPALSHINAMSVKVSATSSPKKDVINEKRVVMSKSPEDSQLGGKIPELKGDEVLIVDETKDDDRTSIHVRTNQLLHTSLSSIEHSDQRVSAGSGGKITDEDDDFW